jgi:hypothetical protein
MLAGAALNRFLIAIGALVAIALAVPLVAFVIVPIFARSTLHEAAPMASASPAPAAPTSGSPAGTPAPPSSQVLLTGGLRRLDAVHYGSGTVTAVRIGEQRFLRFESVEIAGAPNMFVYLSMNSDGQPGSYSDLGALKATNGSFNYEIPTGLDLSRVRSMVVWCRAFSVTVTWAPLTAPT